ncbi:hypothetical protein C8Q77DRAFT_520449 [Trametes polyzona]|nr:hypothetical protein C8Q77DRAFT_520449 [Trametes polyzona]
MFSAKLGGVLALFVAAVSALGPDVIRATVTSPQRGDLWVGGSTQTVTWVPPALTVGEDPKGSIYLGYQPNGIPNEHLDLDHPLAVNVSMSAGSAQVEVPKKLARDDYIIALFNSANVSPKFSIH